MREIKTESYNNLLKSAGPRRIKDRGIDWKEKYHDRSIKLKERFDKEIGEYS